MAETQNRRAKGKSLGKYCVTGRPDKVSLKNNSKTEGISMHRFPSDSSVRAKWACFVKDIVRNGSHQALRCFAQHISWSQILNNGLILVHKNRKISRLRDG